LSLLLPLLLILLLLLMVEVPWRMTEAGISERASKEHPRSCGYGCICLPVLPVAVLVRVDFVFDTSCCCVDLPFDIDDVIAFDTDDAIAIAIAIAIC